MDKLILIFVCIFFVMFIMLKILLLPALYCIKKMKTYEKIQGKIIDKKIKRDSDGTYVHYKYEYTYLYNTYQIEDKGFSMNKRLEVGDIVDIYVKPGCPEIYLYPNQVRDRYILLIFGLLGLLPVCLLLFMFMFML